MDAAVVEVGKMTGLERDMMNRVDDGVGVGEGGSDGSGESGGDDDYLFRWWGEHWGMAA